MHSNKYAELIMCLQKSLQKTNVVLAKYKKSHKDAVLDHRSEDARKTKRRIDIIEEYCSELQELIRSSNGGLGKLDESEWEPYYNKLSTGLMDMLRKYHEVQILTQSRITDGVKLASRGIPNIVDPDHPGDTYPVQVWITLRCVDYAQYQIHLRGLLFHLDRICETGPVVGLYGTSDLSDS